MHSGMAARPGLWRFGAFELDRTSGELRRNGTLIHLPPQPLQILALLIANAGQVVDRERIRREVWGETAVDFDRSLNVAIAQIRSALNGDAASPRFVQTVPRRGYRFVAELQGNGSGTRLAGGRGRPTLAIAAILAIVLAAVLSAAAFRYWHPAPGPIRIAVLPFEGMALDAAEAARSDGLLTGLGGIQPDRLQVIGRRSVYALDTRGPGSIRALGNRLNVQYVLESSIHREGDALRVAARLVDAGSEAIRWSATFSEEATGSASDEGLVGRVSAGVLTTLFPGASPPAAEATCREGRDAFDTGRMLAMRGGMKDLERSLAFFQQAACPQARAQNAEVLVRLERIGGAAGASWESARSAAQSALKADGSIALAHLALGNVAFWNDWNWAAAQREFHEALRLNPSNPDAHHDLAWLEVAMGRRSDAAASLETAIAIDSLSARTRMDSAWLLLQLGQFDRAAAEARRALELDPRMNEARFCLSRALLYGGDVQGAVQALNVTMPGPLAREIGALPASQAMRRLVEFQAGDATSDPYQRAWQLALVGARAEALTCLEEAFAKHSPMMPLVAANPAFRALRGEARFRAILTRMALPH
jgi:DNA-binding winged helix-turn-helix (wHTH) protein/TolB-like protein/tetratricopeptide (TPR) repeat protein